MPNLSISTAAQFSKAIDDRNALNNIVDVTFFVPCYNEENAIRATLEKICKVAKESNLSYEILVCDDCSSDNSVNEVEDFASQNPNVFLRINQNSLNRGLGHNYLSCAHDAVGKYYIMVCGDDSETEESLIDILAARGKAEIVVPYFDKDTRTIGRRITSFLFTNIVNLLGGFNLKYYNGVVLHLRENVTRCAPSSSGFGYQAELLTILLHEGTSFIHIPISNKDRESGISRAFRLQNIASVGHSLLQILLRRIRCIIWPVNPHHQKS